MPGSQSHSPEPSHAFADFHGRQREGVFCDRRGMLKASLAGIGGLTLPRLLMAREAAAKSGRPMNGKKSVILLWMAGGPSHIDTWDPKPDRPWINRGPFGVTKTNVPGVIISEYLPRQAAMMDKFTIIRSVDCRKSNHEPNMVMQTGNREAGPRVNRKGHLYPGFGSVIAKMRGPNHPAVPPYVAFMRSRSHMSYGGYLGKQYDPFIANMAVDLPIYNNVGVDTGNRTGAKLFQPVKGFTTQRINRRESLRRQLDKLRSGLDQSGSMEAMDGFARQSVEMIIGNQARAAFDLKSEPKKNRDRYGKHLWCQQALLARRLVESGVAFVTLDLSYHGASGTWDTHGDNIPPYGGITKGLGPLLPLFDHLLTTLVSDLGERGMLDDVLVIAMGEFGRTPNMGTQGSTDGRNHWPEVMSMVLAGGGMRHGQVIGATESDGGHIKNRPVTPGDLAATIYRHMDVPLDAAYPDRRGRPLTIVQENGQPLRELF